MNKQVDLEVYFRDTSIIAADRFEVLSYSPRPAAERAPATEVHIMTRELKYSRLAFVVRLKSRAICEELLAALKLHMDEVWPISSSNESQPGEKS